MLTHNRADFEQLTQQYFAEQERRAGSMIAVRRPVYELAKRILIILNAVAADEMRNQVRYIRPKPLIRLHRSPTTHTPQMSLAKTPCFCYNRSV